MSATPDFSDLSAGDVVARYQALKPSARHMFADEVFCYGTSEQATTLAKIAYPVLDTAGAQLDLFGGEA